VSFWRCFQCFILLVLLNSYDLNFVEASVKLGAFLVKNIIINQLSMPDVMWSLPKSFTSINKMKNMALLFSNRISILLPFAIVSHNRHLNTSKSIVVKVLRFMKNCMSILYTKKEIYQQVIIIIKS